MSTSAASGSSTMALRKNVVKPNVRPKPGQHAGSRWKPLTSAVSASRYTTSTGRASAGRRAASAKRSASVARCPATPRTSIWSRAARPVARAQLPGARRRSAARCASPGRAGLRLGARIEQLRACRAGAASPASRSGTMPRYTASAGHMAQQAGRHRERRARVPPRPAQWMQHALRRRARLRGSTSTSSAPRAAGTRRCAGAVRAARQ